MSKARNMARMGQDTSAGYTGAFDMPAGTTAERPTPAGLGWTRLNTDTGSVEVYDGTNWNAVTRPFISSVTGTIYAGAASNLVVAGQNFTSTITVRFLEGGSTVADVTGVTVTAGSATVTVPAAVYGQTAGDSIQVKVINSDGTISTNEYTEIVVALPTGGTITIAGGYRYHTFNSSSSLVVPSGFTATADYLVVAGGGGGGHGSASGANGGGGAGGAIDSTISLSAQTYSIVIGGGGASRSSSAVGGSGVNSTGFGSTAIGGGGGGSRTGGSPTSGGSGGGAGCQGGGGQTGAAGTAGQGSAGGNQGADNGTYAAGGGGGAGGVGAVGNSSGNGGAGGVGINWKSLGTFYAGGGGGGTHQQSGGGTAGGAGGNGGGGNGGIGASLNIPATNGSPNTGGGGGGNGQSEGASGAGGSGIVIVRYAL